MAEGAGELGRVCWPVKTLGSVKIETVCPEIQLNALDSWVCYEPFSFGIGQETKHTLDLVIERKVEGIMHDITTEIADACTWVDGDKNALRVAGDAATAEDECARVHMIRATFEGGDGHVGACVEHEETTCFPVEGDRGGEPVQRFAVS